MVQKSNIKKRWTKISAIVSINANNKDQAKENKVKSDGNIIIL